MSKAENQDEGAAVKPKRAARRKTAAKTRRRSKKLPPYNVVLIDDNDHTDAYVVDMLGKIFGYPDETGYEMAQTVNSAGRVIVMTTHKELAELKRDQIIGFGADPRVEHCEGPMSAVVEPAESQG